MLMSKYRILTINRKTIIVFGTFLIGALLVHSIIDFQAILSDAPFYYGGLEKQKRDSHDKDFFMGSKFIINTTGCQIPRTPIFPEFFKLKWHLEKIPNCEHENILSTLAEDQIIRLKPEYENSSCCLYEITRVENEDKGYKLSACQKISTFADVSKKEILVTKCGNHLTFDVNLPIRPSVQEKLDYWRQVPIEEQPPSILMYGIDTVSRSHAFRSLPETISLMKEMGFVDFKGYHSLAPATLNNFMGFLMGLPREQVRSGCAPNWTSPFDSCPFIWKEFSQQNYLTMYIEDGSQTFNWGGQSGFRQRPTDYYSHALFAGIKDLRKKYSWYGRNEDRVDCTSTETVPEFVFRYTEKFVRKFRDVPFFSFTWLADPFHDNQFTLGTLDKKTKGFTQLLNSLPDLLGRSIIIFISDHGDRFSFFQTKSIEGFIERGLPPIFIRFPKNLRKRFPNLDKVLEINTEALTSPFDLHHTFKHILSLQEQSSKSKVPSDLTDVTTTATFKPVLNDRTSLFVPVDTDRSCGQLHVQAGNCVCGTSLEVDPVENPFFLSKIMEFAGERLNRFVSSSKYYHICAKWTATVDNILSSRILKRDKKFTESMIQFSATPGDAKFQVTIKVLHEKSVFDGCELLSEFERVNAYGNQSFCVNFETDEDKKMKELCMCKSLVKENPHPT